jgi:hypothetical protein
MPMLLGSPFAEPSELDQMAEVPTGTSPGSCLLLLDEMSCTSELVQKSPLTMPCSSHSSIHSGAQSLSLSLSPHIPIPQLASNLNFALNIQQALNKSLEAYSMTLNRIGGSNMDLLTRYLAHKHQMMHSIFNFGFFMLWVVLQLLNTGIVYLEMWLNSRCIHARMLLCRVIMIHLLLEQVLSILALSLLSLHTATILYLCILYIQKAILMVTEVDPEAILA